MRRGLVFWFTGLSGAGKSTVAGAVRDRLVADGRSVLILDGDDVRARFHRHLGFSEDDIRENNRLIAGLCAERRVDHDAILVPVIAPFAESRAAARAALAPGFYEIYCTAGLQVVAKRDPKGLYAKARSGAIANLIGYSPGTRYDVPANPDLRLDTAGGDPALAIARMLAFARARLARHPPHVALSPEPAPLSPRP